MGLHGIRDANSITEGVIWKQILAFLVPIMLGNLLQQLYNTVDAMVVGRHLGPTALAAVGGTSGVLINLLVNFFIGLSSGATVIIAQHYGAQQREDVARAVHTAIAMAIGGGALIMVIGIIGAPFALRMMGVPGDVMPYSITFLRVYFSGMIFSLVYNVGTGILRAVGDSRRPLYFLFVSVLVNIALALLFVMVFNMGVAGTALATVVAQLVSATLVILTLTRSEDAFRLDIRKVRFHLDVLKRILRIGVPAGVQSSMFSIANLFVQSCVNSFGTKVVAAWVAFNRIDGLFWMMSSALGVSITTFVGQNFGAHKYDRIRKSVRVCLVMGLLIAGFFSTVLPLLSNTLLGWFTDDLEVLNYGVYILMSMVPFYALYVFVEILSGASRGTGASFVPMVMVIVGVCLLRILWVKLWMPTHHDVRMLAYCYPITWGITAVMFIVYYLRGNWLRHQIAKAGYPPEVRGRKADADPLLGEE